MDSGFQINNMLLVESNFSRRPQVNFNESADIKLDINVEVSVNNKEITVIETVDVSVVNNEEAQVSIKVIMAGIFEQIGENPTICNPEEFGRINGAAIIFPYIREHITNLSVKACIKPIILPPVNFTKLSNVKS